MDRSPDLDKSSLHGSFVSGSGALDFIYSPFDTPETASGGVIFSLTMPAGIIHSALRTLHSTLRILPSALRTLPSALRTPHSALRTPHSALRTPH